MARRTREVTTKLKVRTPITTDGVNLDFGGGKSIQYKETLLADNAVTRRELESQNATLPENLKMEWEVVSVDGSSIKKAEKPADTTAPSAKAATAKGGRPAKGKPVEPETPAEDESVA